jgi:D-galactonate transporter
MSAPASKEDKTQRGGIPDTERRFPLLAASLACSEPSRTATRVLNSALATSPRNRHTKALPPPHPTHDTPAVARRTLLKITAFLLPFLWLLFIINYLDRTNISMAKLRMLPDLNLSEAVYGAGAGIFFIGYFLFEVPSNLILHRVGARKWIARIMITWGLCSGAMFLTRGAWSFYTIRFLLGLAEAGFFPGIVFYLTHWVPAARRSRVLATFLTATAVSGLVGNPLAGQLMRLDGIRGLHGWQWLFLIEGIPPILLGIAILCVNILPDAPVDAGWLSDEERNWITAELARDHEHPHINHLTDLRSAALDARLWLLSAIYFFLIMGLYGFIFWVPTLVKQFSGASDANVGFMSATPFLVATISMVLIGIHADHRGRPRRHVVACASFGAVGMGTVAAVAGTHHVSLGLATLCLASIGIFGTLGPFWTIPTRYLRGTAAAGGLAFINSVGAMAGFVVQPTIGWLKDHTGSYAPGMLMVSASLAIGALLMLFVPKSADGAR